MSILLNSGNVSASLTTSGNLTGTMSKPKTIGGGDDVVVSVALPAPLKWGQTTIPSDIATGMSDIAYGNGRFVMLCGGPSAVITADFVNYKRVELPESWARIKFLNGQFVLIGRGNSGIEDVASNTIKYSTNGEKWTEATLPATTYWTDIDYGHSYYGDYYVAISGEYGGSESNIAAYSTDLVNWTQVSLPVSEAWVALRYGNGWFVAISYTGEHLAVFPPSRLEWSDVGAFGDGLFFNIYFHNEKFYIPIAKGFGDGTNEILVGNPLEFEKKTLPVAAQWENMAFGAGYGIVFANTSDGLTKIQDACYTADDGETWEHIVMPAKSRRYAADYGKGTFACLGGCIEFCHLVDNF